MAASALPHSFLPADKRMGRLLMGVKLATQPQHVVSASTGGRWTKAAADSLWTTVPSGVEACLFS